MLSTSPSRSREPSSLPSSFTVTSRSWLPHLIAAQQHGGIAVAPQAAPAQARRRHSCRTRRRVAFRSMKWSAILRHGAVVFSHKAQVVHRYTCQIAGGIGVLAVQLVENHAAGEGALGLAHSDGGHLLTVSGHGGSHQEAVGRMKGELLYTILVVHLHRGLIAPAR